MYVFLCIFVLTITTTNTFSFVFSCTKSRFSTVTKGKYHGLKKVRFTHSNSDKTCKLSLVNYNLRESGTGDNKTDIISDPHDHLCTVWLLKYHMKYNLPLYWQGFLFLRKASTDIIKLLKLLGITFCVDIAPTNPTDSTPRGKVKK
jgi:hypothetical protein